MPRTRTKPFLAKVTRCTPSGGCSPWYDYASHTESMTDEKVKPCQLRVTKYEKFEGVHTLYPDGSSVEGVQAFGTYLATDITWRDHVAPFLNRLNPKKLATSNQADLLTAFAEFDDTIAQFSTGFKKSLSYGGVKWGWMPLISDFNACNDAANAVKNSVLDGNRRSQSYRSGDSFTVSSPWISLGWCEAKHTWDVKVKYTGSVSYENDVLAFYDYMGFHPTPKLLWDLVPLSFAVDYILPIGDILSNLTPEKGWVKAANFTGWRVIKASVTETYRNFNFGGIVTSKPPVTYVHRDYLNGVSLESRKIRKEIGIKTDLSVFQMVDLAYLSSAFANKAKSLFVPTPPKRKR